VFVQELSALRLPGQPRSQIGFVIDGGIGAVVEYWLAKIHNMDFAFSQ